MYLAYLDESGDSGYNNSPTNFFILSCVLVHEANWLNTLDALIAMRRQLKQVHNIPTRPEIKAIDIKSGQGVFNSLGWSRLKRFQLFSELLDFEGRDLPIKVFAVAINKPLAQTRGWEPRERAWTFALERINRFCQPSDWSIIFPDQGHGYFIRRQLRKMRRFHSVPSHWQAGSISYRVERIIEDPNDRKSQDSYFIQLADWNSYAAHRSTYIDTKPNVPNDLWDRLRNVLLIEVNALAGGPPGIVLRPT